MIEMLRRAVVALALAGMTACTGNRPPIPNPTPPPPTPPPPIGVPGKGTPQGPERLLRAVGAKLATNDGKPFEMFMAIPCCMGWDKVENQRWPMASKAFMDETAKYGANAFHFRLGPWYGDTDHETEWSGIGGAYAPGTLDWNPAFWTEVRELVWHAYEASAYVEVVPIDTWYVKHCSWGDQDTPWPKSDCDAAFHGSFTPNQDRLLRKAVEELGCFGNVIWATGNEEGEVPAAGDLYQRYVETIRDEERKSGCNFAHIIGTGSDKDGIEADYRITHSKSPVTGPLDGRFLLNNEHNPEYPPEQEADYFATARAAKQAWAAWRAGASDSDWAHRLELFRAVVGGSAPGGCYAPDSEDSAWGATLTPDQRGPQMMAALNAAKAVVGNRCGATAACDHEPTPEQPCAPPVHLGCLETNGLIAAELRKQGYCATGPWTDATAILAPDGWYEEMHVCSTGDGCYTGNPYKLAWKYNGQNPTPPPTSDGCSAPEPPGLYSFSGPVLHGAWYDATPTVNDHDFCESIGLGTMPDGVQPRNQCPPRPECPGVKCEERAACERQIMGGRATWGSDGALEVNQANENHLQARCSNCSYIEVCDTHGGSCKRTTFAERVP